LGLVVVTGMRPGEVINLQLQDVDWSEGLLTIRNTKFGKSRLIPLHPSTQKILAEYAKQRDRVFVGRSVQHFFVSSRGNHLDKGDIHRTFYVLSRQIGLRAPTANRGPRLHDFRHRFAVETLVRWYRRGEDPIFGCKVVEVKDVATAQHRESLLECCFLTDASSEQRELLIYRRCLPPP
jgi:integrase/recombinase XerD